MRRRSLLHFAFAAALGFAGASCLSPTLPLPPPDPPDGIHAVSDGTWTVSGPCTPGAIVTVFNEVRGEGAVIEDRAQTGRYMVEIEGDLCDLARVTEQVGEETSASTSFVLEEGPPNSSSSVCH